MHNTAFATRNLNWCYVALPVGEVGLRSAVSLCRDGAFAGLNITAPHKNLATTLVDMLDHTAILSGTVNTITCDSGYLTGHNTDSKGFWLHFVEGTQTTNWKNASALVLGAGGTSRAVCTSLAQAEMARVHVAARTVESATRVVGQMQSYWDKTRWTVGELNRQPLADMTFDVIINTTPVGMGMVPDSHEYNECAAWFIRIIDSVVHPATWFVDTIYRPSLPPFCRAAQVIAAPWLSGLGMLLWQGCVGFELWTGRVAPVEEMRRALSANWSSSP